ncbi:hypothetical protein WS67_16955 [Burkholderia singularis]|uniref:Uncharacterized protein n=1 Tax=Burkholderia singularis TaxID=1503053 RepID=A0A103E137_9BURK|nr:hypothetical protein WS67_16955 [Burkholderia singularis]
MRTLFTCGPSVATRWTIGGFGTRRRRCSHRLDAGNGPGPRLAIVARQPRSTLTETSIDSEPRPSLRGLEMPGC